MKAIRMAASIAAAATVCRAAVQSRQPLESPAAAVDLEEPPLRRWPVRRSATRRSSPLVSVVASAPAVAFGLPVAFGLALATAIGFASDAGGPGSFGGFVRRRISRRSTSRRSSWSVAPQRGQRRSSAKSDARGTDV
jgi:hypothetical protein